MRKHLRAEAQTGRDEPLGPGEQALNLDCRFNINGFHRVFYKAVEKEIKDPGDLGA